MAGEYSNLNPKTNVFLAGPGSVRAFVQICPPERNDLPGLLPAALGSPLEITLYCCCGTGTEWGMAPPPRIEFPGAIYHVSSCWLQNPVWTGGQKGRPILERIENLRGREESSRQQTDSLIIISRADPTAPASNFTIAGALFPGLIACAMTKFFQPNIGKGGRMLRALIGLGLLGIAVGVSSLHWLASAGFAVGGAFCLFEALRGWCIARACGVKTRW